MDTVKQEPVATFQVFPVTDIPLTKVMALMANLASSYQRSYFIQRQHNQERHMPQLTLDKNQITMHIGSKLAVLCKISDNTPHRPCVVEYDTSIEGLESKLALIYYNME